jgi:hypothetical protein
MSGDFSCFRNDLVRHHSQVCALGRSEAEADIRIEGKAQLKIPFKTKTSANAQPNLVPAKLNNALKGPVVDTASP